MYPEENYNDFAEQTSVHQMANQNNMITNQSNMMQYQMEEHEKSLAEAQLECEQTLNRIYHKLRQDILKPNKEGIIEWVELLDEKKRVFTEEGVDKLMQVLESYINKETLLSNFDDKMIARRMLEFSLSLSALLFLKYEIYFRQPTLKECEDILVNRIENRIKTIETKHRILKQGYDLKQIEKEVYDEIEQKIEQELQNIKEEQKKMNLREFEMIFTQLKALVEATHNRAWKGEERGSLRRRFNISEVIGGKPQSMPKRGGGGWFGWGN